MKKNPWIAAVLSFILGGLGQLYLKEYQRAGFFFLLEIVTGALFLFGQNMQNVFVEYTSQILNFSVSVWAAIDAWRIAKSSRPQIPKPKEGREIYV